MKAHTEDSKHKSDRMKRNVENEKWVLQKKVEKKQNDTQLLTSLYVSLNSSINVAYAKTKIMALKWTFSFYSLAGDIIKTREIHGCIN